MTREEIEHLLKKVVAKKGRRMKQIMLSAKERDWLEEHLDKIASRKFHQERIAKQKIDVHQSD